MSRPQAPKPQVLYLGVPEERGAALAMRNAVEFGGHVRVGKKPIEVTLPGETHHTYWNVRVGSTVEEGWGQIPGITRVFVLEAEPSRKGHRVLREAETVELWGVNGQNIAEVLERIAKLTPYEVKKLSDQRDNLYRLSGASGPDALRASIAEQRFDDVHTHLVLSAPTSYRAAEAAGLRSTHYELQKQVWPPGGPDSVVVVRAKEVLEQALGAMLAVPLGNGDTDLSVARAYARDTMLVREAVHGLLPSPDIYLTDDALNAIDNAHLPRRPILILGGSDPTKMAMSRVPAWALTEPPLELISEDLMHKAAVALGKIAGEVDAHRISTQGVQVTYDAAAQLKLIKTLEGLPALKDLVDISSLVRAVDGSPDHPLAASTAENCRLISEVLSLDLGNKLNRDMTRLAKITAEGASVAPLGTSFFLG